MSFLPTYLEQGLVPDKIQDSDELNIILGYSKYDKNLFPNVYALKRIITDGNGEITILYPYGRFDFVFSWENSSEITDWRQKDFPL